MVSTKHDAQVLDWDDEDEPTTKPVQYPIYKQMGSLVINDVGSDGPIVAMARLISDDAEAASGTYTVELPGLAITIDVAHLERGA